MITMLEDGSVEFKGKTPDLLTDTTCILAGMRNVLIEDDKLPVEVANMLLTQALFMATEVSDRKLKAEGKEEK